MIDHDRLFKELIATFFIEFLELFFPQVIAYLEPDSLKFLDKEVFTDVTAGEQYEADLVVQVRFREQKTFFLCISKISHIHKLTLGAECFVTLRDCLKNTLYLYI